jgi:carboxyl-terminal processing protease
VFLSAVLFAISSAADSTAQNRIPASRPPATARPAGTTQQRPTADAVRRIETFRKAWSVLGEHYFDPTFNKLDWKKVRLEYEPKVRAAETDKELHRLLSEMIGRLGRSHLAIIPPEVYRAIEAAKVEAKVREARKAAETASDSDEAKRSAAANLPEGDDPLTQYGIGVDLRILNGQFVITRLDPDSPAEKAGLKTGFVIDRVNNVALSGLLTRLESAGAASPPMKRQLIYQVVTGFLNGEKDSEVAVTVLDERGSSREVPIKREKLPTQVISLMTGMPERHLRFEQRSIADDIGYIRFDYFAVPVIDQFCSAVGEFRNKKGLIIDLRGNFGGLLATMPTFAGMLSEEKIDLGTSIFRNNAERLTGWPKVKNFKGKIVFLIDGHSTSAAEIFAAAMQESGRAFLVGERSPGEALPSVAVELPTGAVLQYPIANYKTSTGKFLEGSGVSPDYAVPLTRASLLQGNDPQLDKAVELLRGDRRPNKRDMAAGQRAPDFLGQIPAAVLPPIPAPRKEPADSASKTFTVNPAEDSTPEVFIDRLAAKLIDDFLQKIGGREAVLGISTYAIAGRTELFVKGTRNKFHVDIYRDGPAKYAEILSAPSAGEIREVHNGKTITIQSDYGLTQEIPKYSDVVDTDILGPLRSLAQLDYFVSLKYHGVFDRQGKKVHLVDGKSRDGMMIALAFDSKTGLLTTFTGAYYGMQFGDYEKAGNLMLPHRIERERIMTLDLDEITVNEPVDPSKFAKRLKCYDTEN